MNKLFPLFSVFLLAALLLAACQPSGSASVSLGDLTWLDANANGLQDAGEQGLADVQARLYDANGNMLAETRSNADGRYIFADLQPGDYTLEFVAPDGYALTKADQGEDDARDSDPDPSSGKTALIFLTAGQSSDDWDAGFVPEVAALPTETPTPEPTLTSTPSGPPIEPEEVFLHGKAAELLGLYYPPTQSDALLVVFLHSVNNDMSEWKSTAALLQKLGYGALTITYSGCQPAPAGCPMQPPAGWFFDTMPETWLFDSMMLLSQISNLMGIPPSRIVVIGSSMGADGAVIACAEIGCAGALALSPGNFLALSGAPDTTYLGAVQRLLKTNPQAVVWCVANEIESEVCKKAESAGGASYRVIEITGGGHGSELVDAEMRMIQEFLEAVKGK